MTEDQDNYNHLKAAVKLRIESLRTRAKIAEDASRDFNTDVYREAWHMRATTMEECATELEIVLSSF